MAIFSGDSRLFVPATGLSVQYRSPTSDAFATPGVFTAHGGTGLWECVDEFSDSDDATTYMSGVNTLTGIYLAGFPVFTLPPSAEVHSVAVTYRAYCTAAGTGFLVGNMVSNGDEMTGGGGSAQPTSYATVTRTWLENPFSGAPWTVDEVNGVGTDGIKNIGFLLVDNSANPVNITQLYIRALFYGHTSGSLGLI
jgi:hypothetical protein